MTNRRYILLNIKVSQRRRLLALFCAFLFFAMLLAPAVYAESAVITSGTMYSYFETYSSQGVWVDIQTPAHWITDTGEVAYCLQTSKDNPSYSSYSTIDGDAVYDEYVLTGLRAILNNGYPADNGGFDDQQARYATANAIRFWMAENLADGMPQYLNLTVNGDWIRGKYGYEDLFDWSLYLLELARAQNVNPINIGSLAFSPTEITLSQDASGQYFTGTVYLNKQITGDYSLMDNSPDSSLITSGHTGVQSETLTLSIPVQYANQEFLLCAYGMDDAPSARLFFWQPDAWNQQRLVTYVLDDTASVFVRGFLTIRTPSASVQPQKGSLQITKTDESGNPLSGVGFTLYDSSGNMLSTKTTNSSGIVVFSDLVLGNYYYAETSALTGYVLDSTQYPVTISTTGQVVQQTMTNSLGKGSLQITKTDEAGNALFGVEFTLYDGSGTAIGSMNTDIFGVVTFANLPLGNYYYAETAALSGYVLDSTLYPVTISSAGQVVTKTMTNSQGKGSLKLVKTDESGNPIGSTGFCLYDSSGIRITSGSTDSSGVLIFSNLPLGSYYYQESFAIPGYALDDTMYPFSITENGQVITKTVVNYRSAGTIKILKTDSETGAPLQGAEFTLMNASYQDIATGITDESGLVTFSGLTLGYYYIQETNAPPGYVPYGHIDQVLLDANGKVISKTYPNTPARGSLKIIKKNGDGAYLSGVEFKLYDANQVELRSGSTDANGVLLFENLPVGDYFIAEITELPGYIPNHSLQSARVGYHGCVEEITVTNYAAHGHLRVIKTDESGSPLAGVHFQLTDAAGNLVSEGDTDSNGKILFTMLPVGQYILRETATLTGYVLDDTPIPFELTRDGEVITKEITNTRSTGSVSILKTDADSGAALAGAHFTLTNASGTVVKEGDTGLDGMLTLSGIPLGAYTLTETAAPTGYVLSSAPITVEVTSAGQTVSKTVTNTRAVGSIIIQKTDVQTGAALAGVHFRLTDSAGSTVREGDTQSDGTLTFTDVPLGSYTLTETATISGYVLDSSPIAVELTQGAQVVSKTIANTPARGGLVVRKTASDTGSPLSGVHFELLNQSGTKLAEGDTGTDGVLRLENLPLGVYRLKETSTASGYILKSDEVPVSISEHNQTVEINVANDPIIGSLKILKRIAGENAPLPGAGYRLYAQDGTQIAEGFTDASGELLFENIPYGSGYWYLEFAAPKGFVLDDSRQPLSVTETESVFMQTLENSRREGTFHILKQNQNGRALQGAVYLLEFSMDNGASWSPVTSRPAGNNVSVGGCTSPGLAGGQLTTGSDGLAAFTGLRADDDTLYRITETKAPEGYSLMAEPLFVGTLPIAVTDPNVEDSETVDGNTFTYTLYITATDSATYRLPEAGGSGFPLIPLGLLFLAVPFFIPKSEKTKENAYENS